MPTDSIEMIAGAHGVAVRGIVHELQALIAETVPDLTCKPNPGWHAITYRHPDAGYVFGVFPYDDRVHLVFEHGAGLADPAGVLEGAHLKQVRYLRLVPTEPLPAAAVTALLHAAVHAGVLRAATTRSRRPPRGSR